jgi:hypothetical protein
MFKKKMNINHHGPRPLPNNCEEKKGKEGYIAFLPFLFFSFWWENGNRGGGRERGERNRRERDLEKEKIGKERLEKDVGSGWRIRR